MPADAEAPSKRRSRLGRLVDALLNVSLRLFGALAGLIAGFLVGVFMVLLTILIGEWAWQQLFIPLVSAMIGSLAGAVWPNLPIEFLEKMPLWIWE